MTETLEIIDIGNQVICDWCGTDFTDRDDQGGILFGSKACCPICTLEVERSAMRYQEYHYIKGRCPAGMSFREWVLELRGGDNTIKFYSGGSLDEIFGKLQNK